MPFEWSEILKFLVAIVSVLLGAVVPFIFKLINDRASVAASQRKIEAAESKVQAEPEKAKPAWDLARATLEAYFNRNLSQVASIFWLSVAVMTLGFATIIFGIIQAIQTPTNLDTAKLSGLAGIITEFIGATFLFIYRSTIEQAIDYSQTLERINSVGMAMQILDTMPDGANDGDLKSKTKATIVELLVSKSYSQTPPVALTPIEKAKISKRKT